MIDNYINTLYPIGSTHDMFTHMLIDLYSFHVGKSTNQSHGNPDHGILMNQSIFFAKVTCLDAKRT